LAEFAKPVSLFCQTRGIFAKPLSLFAKLVARLPNLWQRFATFLSLFAKSRVTSHKRTGHTTTEKTVREKK